MKNFLELGVEWTETQKHLANAMLSHQLVLYKSERRNGTTTVLCGWIASMMQHCPVPFTIVVYVTTPRTQRIFLKTLQQLVGDGGSGKVTLYVWCETKKHVAPLIPDALIVDNADHVDPKIILTRVVPLLQMARNCKMVLTHAGDSSLINMFEEYFHCVTSIPRSSL